MIELLWCCAFRGIFFSMVADFKENASHYYISPTVIMIFHQCLLFLPISIVIETMADRKSSQADDNQPETILFNNSA